MAGLNVGVLYQGDLEQTSSFYAQGGLAAAFDSDDSPLQHMTDTIMAGDGLCDTGVVQGYCSAAPAFVRRLIDLGVPFDQTRMVTFDWPRKAHSSARIFHVKDYTGTAIIRGCISNCNLIPMLRGLISPCRGF